MGRPLGSKNRKSIWLLQSLAKHGYDYERLLVKFLDEAARGNQRSYAMAQLLVKMVPYLAHMPKTDAGTVQIDTLVINRHVNASIDTSVVGPTEVINRLESKPIASIDTTIEEGNPPSITVTVPESSTEKQS